MTAVALSFGATGCAAAQPPLAPQSLVGLRLSEVTADVPDDVGLVVQDVGQEFDADLRYDVDDWGSSEYLVLAACADVGDVRVASEIQLGVVEAEALSANDIARVDEGAYRDYIGCSEGFVR